MGSCLSYRVSSSGSDLYLAVTFICYYMEDGRKKRIKQKDGGNYGVVYLLSLLSSFIWDNTWNVPSSSGGGSRSPRPQDLVLPDSLELIYLQNFTALAAENSITWSCAKYSVCFMDLWRHISQSWESNWKLSSPVWYLTVPWILKETHKKLVIWSLVVMVLTNFHERFILTVIHMQVI